MVGSKRKLIEVNSKLMRAAESPVGRAILYALFCSSFFWSLYYVQVTASDGREALERTNEIQNWTYRRDQAGGCEDLWRLYQGDRTAIITGAESLIETVVATNPDVDPHALDVFRQTTAENADELEKPDCDPAQAHLDYIAAQEELDKLRSQED